MYIIKFKILTPLYKLDNIKINIIYLSFIYIDLKNFIII